MLIEVGVSGGSRSFGFVSEIFIGIYFFGSSSVVFFLASPGMCGALGKRLVDWYGFLPELFFPCAKAVSNPRLFRQSSHLRRSSAVWCVWFL